MGQSNAYGSNVRKHTAVAAATTNATLVAASPTNQLLRAIGGQVSNTTAAFIYLKIFDKATAPVPGTDTPILNIGIPPNGQLDLNDLAGTDGISFVNVFGYALTAAIALLDTTAVTAGAAAINFTYA